jgi:2-phospho-L-lactate/phosphoenolpyruvate guanylyltransferase
MRTAAILPVKRFSLAKRRLGASVADTLRLELAQAMVADVLLALAETECNELTIVVTREESVAQAASEVGALVLDDVAEAGQSAAAELGARQAMASGIERVLCVPGDCPALDPLELDALLGAPSGGKARGASEPQVVIVPDRHGTGTNGLLLSPPDVITPSFGPESCERHRALALAAGVACRVERPASLLLDIDTGADLAALRALPIAERPRGQRALAPNTRAVLARAARASTLPVATSA